MSAPEFEVIGTDPSNPLAMLLYARCCTSLDDEAAAVRMNRENPAGTTNGWSLCTAEHQRPVACQENPATHRHLMFSC